MARIRTIKPDFWRDEDLSAISAEAALLAIGLLNYCDDEGYFNANPRLVQSDVFPLRELSNTTTVLLRELSEIGFIELFDGSDGKQYGHVVNFSKHQVVNKKTSSKIKGLRQLPEDYGSGAVDLPHGNGNGNGNGKEEDPNGSCRADPPDDTKLAKFAATNQDARGLLSYLNERTGRQYRAVESNLQPIRARLGEYSEEVLRAVVDAKVAEWMHDQHMHKYLRPATLFNATKCAQYTGELSSDQAALHDNAFRGAI